LIEIIGKGFAAFLKQGSYQKELSEKIVEIERVSTRFKYISMGCMQREVFNTRKTVTSLAVASGNNHLILKNTVDRTNQSLERLSLGEMKQHEATQQMLGAEFKAWEIRYDDQLELNKKTVDVLNDCKILLESIYVALPLCFQSKEPLQILESNITTNTSQIQNVHPLMKGVPISKRVSLAFDSKANLTSQTPYDHPKSSPFSPLKRTAPKPTFTKASAASIL